MKINYRKPDGSRTSATIPGHIYLAWAASLSQEDGILQALVARVESGLRRNQEDKDSGIQELTRQRQIESLLMDDIKGKLMSCKSRVKKVEK